MAIWLLFLPVFFLLNDLFEEYRASYEDSHCLGTTYSEIILSHYLQLPIIIMVIIYYHEQLFNSINNLSGKVKSKTCFFSTRVMGTS